MTEFDQFHAAYPPTKRETGEFARLAFANALRKVTLQTLLAALDQHKRSAQWEIPRYIPRMTNWLRGERWTHTLASAPAAPAGLSDADQAQRWRSLSPQEQLRRLGYNK